MDPTETTLATIAGYRDDERMVLVLRQTPHDGGTMELRQQSWGDGVGWYTQSSVAMEPHQVAQLRNALGVGGPNQFSALPREFGQLPRTTWHPRLVSADSA